MTMHQVISAIVPPMWSGHRRKQIKDDLSAKLESALARNRRCSEENVSLCGEIQKKIKRSDTATKLAIRMMGANFCCAATAPEDLNCEDCPWHGDCEIKRDKFKAPGRARLS